MTLKDECDLCEYEPTGAELLQGEKQFDNQVARFDFSLLSSVLLMYKKNKKMLDKMRFADGDQKTLATLTLKNPIQILQPNAPRYEIKQYLLAGVFTGDGAFLAHFLGHQGASVKWLCFWLFGEPGRIK